MPELTPQDRLQPCLLDRLTDEQPRQSDEGRDQRVVSPARQRDAIVRDLASLLNSRIPRGLVEAEQYPEIRRSVLCYGIPDFCGMSLHSDVPEYLRRAIVHAITTFEPRVIASTLSVTSMGRGASASRSSLTFEIRCEIWMQPVAEAIYLRTQVDLESGQCQVEAG